DQKGPDPHRSTSLKGKGGLRPPLQNPPLTGKGGGRPPPPNPPPFFGGWGGAAPAPPPCERRSGGRGVTQHPHGGTHTCRLPPPPSDGTGCYSTPLPNPPLFSVPLRDALPISDQKGPDSQRSNRPKGKRGRPPPFQNPPLTGKGGLRLPFQNPPLFWGHWGAT